MKTYLLNALAGLLLFFSPITGLVITVGLIVLLDTFTGIFRSVKLRGWSSIRSRILSNIISKMLLYEICIVLLFPIDEFLLNDLLIRLIDHPKAPGQVFLVSDDEDVSTTRLLRTISSALGKQIWLIPVPAFLLKSLLVVLGRRDLSDRLLGSLQLDISKTKKLLDWKPPVSFDQGIKKTTTAYLDTLK